MIFWDSSALVKCYFESETGHGQARNLLHREQGHQGSALLRPESFSGIIRRFQARPSRAEPVLRLLQDHLDRFTLVELDGDQMDSAVALIRRHALRAGDAIHLAAAKRMAPVLGRRTVRFATADGEQSKAARKEGLKVIEL